MQDPFNHNKFLKYFSDEDKIPSCDTGEYRDRFREWKDVRYIATDYIRMATKFVEKETRLWWLKFRAKLEHYKKSIESTEELEADKKKADEDKKWKTEAIKTSTQIAVVNVWAINQAFQYIHQSFKHYSFCRDNHLLINHAMNYGS